MGDLCYAAASGLIGGALGGAIGGLAGVVGAVIAAVLYRERILRASTLLGLFALAVGIYLAVSGGKVGAPTHGIYFVVGLLIMFGAVLTWGFESFAEYAIWAAASGDMALAGRLRADADRSMQRWDRHTREINRPLIRRLDGAVEATKGRS